MSDSAALARRLEVEAGKGTKPEVAKVSGIRQRPPSPKGPVPTPKAPKAKASPRESRNLFMSRKELTGKPSKLLSDSGVTVIATKTGSSQNPSADVKYVVKKETAGDKKPLDSSGTMLSSSSSSGGGSLMSFEDLLSGEGKPKSSMLGGEGKSETSQSTTSLPSGSDSSKPAPGKPESSSSQPKTETAHVKDKQPTKGKSESAYAKLKPHVPSDASAKGPDTAGISSSEDVSSTGSAVLTKSSSVKDFLASFSSDSEKKEAGSGEDKEHQSNVKATAKSLLSKLPSSITGASTPKQDPSSKDSSSPEPLEESLLPKDEKEQQRLAELILTLASEPTFGSSLSSTDSWTLLLDETAGERTLSYEKLELLANKAKASATKAQESSSKVKNWATDSTGEQSKPGMVRSASTSSLSTSSSTTIVRQSQEVGFHPTPCVPPWHL